MTAPLAPDAFEAALRAIGPAAERLEHSTAERHGHGAAERPRS